MAKVPYFNDTKKPALIGGMTIFPGQCRDVESDLVSPLVSPVDTSTAADPPLWSAAGFLDQSLRDMEDGGLAALELSQLMELKGLEQEGSNRKNVLTAIDVEMLKQAKQTA